MMEFIQEINWSPLWISLKTGFVATVIAFFFGIFCARKIMKLKPINGVAADISSSLIIQIATHLDLPVSTTQVISSSIMGVGASVRKKGVKWGTAVKMFASWFITVPVTILVAFLLFHIVHIFA